MDRVAIRRSLFYTERIEGSSIPADNFRTAQKGPRAWPRRVWPIGRVAARRRSKAEAPKRNWGTLSSPPTAANRALAAPMRKLSQSRIFLDVGGHQTDQFGGQGNDLLRL